MLNLDLVRGTVLLPHIYCKKPTCPRCGSSLTINITKCRTCGQLILWNNKRSAANE